MERKYPNQLVVIGIHTPKFDSEKLSKNIRKAMFRYEIDHPVINDAKGTIWRNYGIQSWPSVILIDPEGNLVGGIPYERVFTPFDRAISQLIRIHRAKKTLDEKPIKFQKVSDAEKGEGPLFFPGKVTADEKSNRLFIADSTHHRIVVTDLAGRKIAIAGTGQPGQKDGAFDQAQFNDPQGMALKGDILFVADRKNHLIRALDLKKQTVKTVAGTGVQENRRRVAGLARKTGLNSPWDLLVWKDYLFIAMAGHHQIWMLDLKRGQVGPFAGTGFEQIVDGPPGKSCFAQPSGLATDGSTLFVADSEVSAIRAVSLPQGMTRTLVGKGLFDFGDVDGPAPQVKLQHPLGVIYLKGKLYLADTYNNKIKVLSTLTNSVETFVGGSTVFSEPAGLSYANGKIYVADTNNHRIRVVDLKTKAVTTLGLSGVEAPEVREP